MRNHHPQRKQSDKHYTPVAELRLMARGQWVAILAAARIPEDALVGRHGRPCPRCGGRDRFSPLPDVAECGAVLCRHCFNGDTDPRPGDGLATLRWWLGIEFAQACKWLEGWLGLMPGYRCWHVPASPVQTVVGEPVLASPELGLMATVMVGNMRPGWLAKTASLLGVSAESLARLSVGWSPVHRAVSFPMRDEAGDVVGIRLRCPRTARKWAVKGSRAGLFYSVAMLAAERPSRIYVTEGPTDSAALLSVELDVVGVPSAGGCVGLLCRLVRRLEPGDVVILADGDGPGQRGAMTLADALQSIASVRIISPPDGLKDARAWVVSGADGAVIDAAASSSLVHPVVNGGANHG